MDGIKKFSEQQANSAVSAIVEHIPGATLRMVDERPAGFDMLVPETSGVPGALIRYDWFKHRFTISGRWPMSTIPGDGQVFHPTVSLHPVPPDTEIGISAAKTPEQIAAEIMRRFWPAYFSVWTECNRRRIQHEDFVCDRFDLAAKLAGALGQPVPSFGANWEPTLCLPDNLTTGENSAYGGITVSGGTVQMQLCNLTPERALKLIEFLKTL